ncbi:MAG TPA: HD domain-containing protein [Longimicrobiaceae bacterium]|jgi:metal-dependent HD superfamily phosphatase/phosphodiesterase|nr:HD domain-containing protein [Longimicrobiaceae bacterium]
MSEVLTPEEYRAEFGRTVAERFANRLTLNVPSRGNKKVEKLIGLINADEELYALWLAANVNAVERLGMTDHGPVHVKIVMNIAVKLLRVLTEHGVAPGVVTNYGMGNDDAEVVVILAALLHDTGMSIHRSDHEGFSLFVAQGKIKELLAELYDVPTATVLRSEVLHAIIAHRSGGKPLTVEAGVVRVADALDMAKGRSRIPFAQGSTSIHSISAAAIEGVTIEAGTAKPVRLRIEMSNSAGVFQLDQLFREKLKGSGLEPYVEVEAHIEGEAEKRLLTSFHL